jgi:phasin family protein
MTSKKGKTMAQQTLSPISDATISILENQIQTFSALTSYFIEATEKFNDLNMAVVKASVEESGETARHLFSLNDQAELFDFISEQPKLMSEKMHFYNQHVAQISSDVKSNVDKVIEEQMTQAS